RSQNELAVGRYLELARLEPEIRDRDPADLGVVLGGDEHLERGRDRAVATMELRPVLGEGHPIAVGLDAGGLVTGRPDRAGLDVPQEGIGAPVVARDVLAPARHREAATSAVARAARGEHHRVTAVPTAGGSG